MCKEKEPAIKDKQNLKQRARLANLINADFTKSQLNLELIYIVPSGPELVFKKGN